jgi:DNA excision repair protein ERCC-4
MRTLYQKTVYLWPRFHIQVSDEFDEATQVNILEMRIPFSGNMKAIHASILECLSSVVSDIKRIQGDNDLSLESALVTSGYSFTESYKTRFLFAELYTLKHLLSHLLSLDPVSFLIYLENLRRSVSTSSLSKGESLHWLLSDAAQTIFECSKDRVFKGSEVNIEQAPKWKCLFDILQKIHKEREEKEDVAENEFKILIMCQDERTKRALSRIIGDFKQDKGCIKAYNAYLLKRYYRLTRQKQTPLAGEDTAATSIRQPIAANKRRRVRGGKSDNAITRQSVMPPSNNEQHTNQSDQEEEPELEALPENDSIVINSYSEFDDFLLENVKPQYIILYDASVHFIRCIEVQFSLIQQLGISSRDRTNIECIFYDV